MNFPLPCYVMACNVLLPISAVVSVIKWLTNMPSIHETQGVISSITKEHKIKHTKVNCGDPVIVVMSVIPYKTTPDAETGKL